VGIYVCAHVNVRVLVWCVIVLVCVFVGKCVQEKNKHIIHLTCGE